MAHATGKYAKAISDRSGREFPYKEMVKEWNGSFVHQSEFEAKHPQLDRSKHTSDAQSLKNVRPARKEPMTVFVGKQGFFDHNDTMKPESRIAPVVGFTIGKVTVSTS